MATNQLTGNVSAAAQAATTNAATGKSLTTQLEPTKATPATAAAPTAAAAVVNNSHKSQTANNKNKGIITITTNQSTINQLPKEGDIVCVKKTSNGLHTVQEMQFTEKTTAEIGSGLNDTSVAKKGGRRSKKTRKQKKNRKQKKTKGRRRH